jgi:hypothetical protein
MTEDIMETNLAHSVSVKPVKILHDVRHLPLQHELTTLLEVQTGNIDHGKQHAIDRNGIRECLWWRIGYEGWP